MEVDEVGIHGETHVSRTNDSPPQSNRNQSIDVQALAEAVMVMLESADKTHQANTQTLNQLATAQNRIASAPDLMRQGVERGIQDSLQKFDVREDALDRRSTAIDTRGRKWLLRIWASALLLGALLIGITLLWLTPQIKKYSDYQQSHPAVEQDSLFGAQFRQNDEGHQFIVFDEGITFKECSVPNCVAIDR